MLSSMTSADITKSDYALQTQKLISLITDLRGLG